MFNIRESDYPKIPNCSMRRISYANKCRRLTNDNTCTILLLLHWVRMRSINSSPPLFDGDGIVDDDDDSNDKCRYNCGTIRGNDTLDFVPLIKKCLDYFFVCIDNVLCGQLNSFSILIGLCIQIDSCSERLFNFTYNEQPIKVHRIFKPFSRLRNDRNGGRRQSMVAGVRSLGQLGPNELVGPFCNQSVMHFPQKTCSQVGVTNGSCRTS
ncbi:hypothetical protein BLOT_014377 [Blomia tropicalis]|nr:hypothetical protein BLOT_014377 [Blomia tropicalis]